MIKKKAFYRIISDCIINHKIIKITYIRWFKRERLEVTTLFEPYLLGEDRLNLDNFVFGKRLDSGKLTTWSLKELYSVETTNEHFSTLNDSIEYKPFSNSERIIVFIPEIIIDKYRPQFPEDEEDDSEYYRQPCIYCGSEENCKHRVFLYDRSYSECISGHCEELYEIRQMVENTFLLWLNNKKKIVFSKKPYENHLWDMWIWAKKDFKIGETCLNFDGYSFIDLVKEIIEEILPDRNEPYGDIFTYASGGGPGMDSVMWVCYADNPKRVLKAVETVIKEMLMKGLQ